MAWRAFFHGCSVSCGLCYMHGTHPVTTCVALTVSRKYHACPSQHSGYGAYLGEFMFRMRFLRAPSGHGRYEYLSCFAFSR
eukprot:1540385-Amphidinium_carterae.1